MVLEATSGHAAGIPRCGITGYSRLCAGMRGRDVRGTKLEASGSRAWPDNALELISN
jgi:hypothetical protein